MFWSVFQRFPSSDTLPKLAKNLFAWALGLIISSFSPRVCHFCGQFWMDRMHILPCLLISSFSLTEDSHSNMISMKLVNNEKEGQSKCRGKS